MVFESEDKKKKNSNIREKKNKALSKPSWKTFWCRREKKAAYRSMSVQHWVFSLGRSERFLSYLPSYLTAIKKKYRRTEKFFSFFLSPDVSLIHAHTKCHAARDDVHISRHEHWLQQREKKKKVWGGRRLSGVVIRYVHMYRRLEREGRPHQLEKRGDQSWSADVLLQSRSLRVSTTCRRARSDART